MAVSRSLQVLDVLRTTTSASLAQLHLETDINKATLLRILQTLQESHWVIKSTADHRYRLSVVMQQNSTSLEENSTLAELATPFLRQIEHNLHWPTDVAVRDKLTMRLVESTRPQASFIVNKKIRDTRPHFLYSAIGRAYLAFCTDQERNDILSGLKKTAGKEARLAMDQRWIDRLLKETRERGYGIREVKFYGKATNNNQYLEAIAVPVFDASKICATLSVTWPMGVATPKIIEQQFYPSLRKAADELGTTL